MTMSIPIGSCFGDRIADLFPGLETTPLERQGTQRLPPGLYQVQVGRVGRLEDELRARMGQREQQDVSGSMHRQVIQNGLDALYLSGNPLVHLGEKIDPVDRCPPIIGNGQGLSAGRLKGSKDIALGPASI